MTWKLYLYDEAGDTIGTANHFESSFSVDMDAPRAEALRDALAERPELEGNVGPVGGWESEDGLAYPVWGEEAADIEDPEVALDRVGSEVVSAGLADSYELIDE
ncbi:hypothetical protein [Halorubrum sp. F4]|uniref:hypothetical protein n=1 Tax=Halorubrum sp. F4 TaxID=2989715 RepID=UPI0024818D03|nr:hypothetical protein [Halorubrum sp. F4]